MKKTDISQLFADSKLASGRAVTVGGWVKTSRESKNVGFLELNDGSCFKNLQVVISAEDFDNFKECANIPVGTAVVVNGIVVATPNAKQPIELSAKSIEIEGECPSDYPLQKKRHSLEFLRTMPHLRARTNTYSAVFRVRSEAAYAIHEFFHSNGFVYVHTPIITGSDCEGAGTMFRVTTLDPKNPPLTEDGEVDWSCDFFGRETNLTVSGQLEGETMAQTFGKIYTFGPTFRAERSNTTRHAAEFWMIEPEMAFSDLTDYMDNAEAMIKFVVAKVLERCPDEIKFFNDFYDKTLLERLNVLVNSDFRRVTYTEACEILEKHNDKFEYKVSWGCDLRTEIGRAHV